MPTDPLVTQEELAELLGVSIHAVRKWRQEGKIEFIRVNNTVRFERTAVLAFINAHRVPTTPSLSTP